MPDRPEHDDRNTGRIIEIKGVVTPKAAMARRSHTTS